MAARYAAAAPILQLSLILNEDNPLHLRFDDGTEQTMVGQLRRKKRFFTSGTLGTDTEINAAESFPRSVAKVLTNYCKNDPAAPLDWQLPMFGRPYTVDGASAEETLSTSSQHRQAFNTRVSQFLRETFSYNEPISSEAASCIVAKLWRIQKNVQQLAYWHKTLQKASDAVAALAPALQDTLTTVQQTTLIQESEPKYKPDAVAGDGVTHTLDQAGRSLLELIGSNAMSSFSRIYPPYTDLTQLETTDKQSNHDVHLVVIFHELVHLITCTILFTNDPLQTQPERPYVASLYFVIHEGISLAFEIEYLEKTISNENTTAEQKERLQAYLEIRKTYLKESFTLWRPRLRNAFIGKEKAETKASTIGELQYAEGAYLAHRLQQNGWVLNQLPILAEKIREIVQNELHTKNMSATSAVPLDREPGSHYSRIRYKIKTLKPS